MIKNLLEIDYTSYCFPHMEVYEFIKLANKSDEDFIVIIKYKKFKTIFLIRNDIDIIWKAEKQLFITQTKNKDGATTLATHSIYSLLNEQTTLLKIIIYDSDEYRNIYDSTRIECFEPIYDNYFKNYHYVYIHYNKLMELIPDKYPDLFVFLLFQ